jgi:hypothetical protein
MGLHGLLQEQLYLLTFYYMFYTIVNFWVTKVGNLAGGCQSCSGTCRIYLKMEAECFSETVIFTCKATRCRSLKDNHHTHGRENVETYTRNI